MLERKNYLLKQKLKNLQEQKDLLLNLSSCSLVLLAQFISLDGNLNQNFLQTVR
jgi:hypothetical protein